VVRQKVTAKERAVSAAIDILRTKLLDLTGRNQLLSFKHSERSRKHVRLVDVIPGAFVEQLEKGADIRFHSLPEPDDEPADEKSSQFRKALERAIASDPQYLKNLKELGDNPSERALGRAERDLRDRVREQLGLPKRPATTRDSASRSERAKALGIDPSYELPVDNADGNAGVHKNKRLQTLLYPDELERKLRGIYEQARSSVEERGVNTLFAAVGFLEWYESETQNAEAMYSPLLLYPLEVKRELLKGRYVYTARSTGDEPSENLPLRERLKRDFSLRIPDLDPEKDTPDQHFRKVASAVRTKRDWKVHRYITIGHFEFTKLPMYHDLDQSNWQLSGTGLATHAVLSDLLGGTTGEETSLYADEYEVDESPIADNLPLLVTDADSSQLSAIIEAMGGRNLVIEGPPGTGKSQTITNLIAAALARGKSVLFVAEKMAALDVVKSRLDQAGLGEFCLELHSYKAKRRDVLDALAKRLQLSEKSTIAKTFSRGLSEIKQIRDQLNRYARTLNQPFGTMGHTLHDVLWKCQKLREEERVPDFVGEVRLRADHAMKISETDAVRDKDLLTRFERQRALAVGARGSLDQHPWYGIRNDELTFVEEGDVIRAASDLKQRLAQLAERTKGIANRFAITLNSPKDLLQFSALIEKLPDPTPEVLIGMLPKLSKSEPRQWVNEFLERSASIRSAIRTLQESFEDYASAEQVSDQLTRLAHEVDSHGFAQLNLEGLLKLADHEDSKASEVEELTRFAERLVGYLSPSLPVSGKASRIAVNAVEFAAQLRPELLRLVTTTTPQSNCNGVSSTSVAGIDSSLELNEFTRGSEIAGSFRLKVDQLVGLTEEEELKTHRLHQLVEFAGRLVRCLSGDLSISASTAAVALRAAEQAVQIVPEVLSTCSRNALAEGASSVLPQVCQEATLLRERRADLLRLFDISVNLNSLTLRQSAETLRNSRRFSFLRSDFRRARRVFKRINRENRSLGTTQMAQELEALAEYEEAVENFEMNPKLQELCGADAAKLDTDFGVYVAVAEWADNVRVNFKGEGKAEQAAKSVLLSGNASEVRALGELLHASLFEDLKKVLRDCGERSPEIMLQNLYDKQRERAAEIATLAHWCQRVLDNFSLDDPARQAAARVLLSGDSHLIQRLTAEHREPSRKSLDQLLKDLGADSDDTSLHELCRPFITRARAVRDLARRIQSIKLQQNVSLSLLRALGVTAARLQELRLAARTATGTISLTGDEFAADVVRAAALRATNELADTIETSTVPSTLKEWLFEGPYDDRISRLKTAVREAIQDCQQVAVLLNTFNGLTRLDLEKWTGTSLLDDLEIERLVARFGLALASPETLGEWVQYLRLNREVVEAELDKIVEVFLRHDSEPKDLSRAYDRVLFESLVRAASDSFPEIARFSGARHEALRERFKELDRTVLELQRKQLRADLLQRPKYFGIGQGPKSEWTGLNLVINEIHKQRRLLSIRRLMERAGSAIIQIKPCFMMSPLSIAQYLPPGAVNFDLVVMDEASQIRPEEALGAIARGAQVIVVGDSKQLPPSRFFEYAGELPPGDDDDVEDDVGNEESVLDMASGMFRPPRQLRWHYRSRHGSLIAFSNERFYDGRLIAFPSAHRKSDDFGVHFVSVAGNYRSGVNPLEAQEIIRAAGEFIQVHPKRSLGIVAMNIAQRDLLAEELDRISAERQEVQEYREHWQETLYPLFVKNLENVQGDERDVIFVSMTYGPDEGGHFYQRFGPINSSAGHRRLNVLFTRAREKLVVFTSMDPNRIQVQTQTHEGVKVLKDYLQFAKEGILEKALETDRPPDSDFEIIVARALLNAGLEVSYQVGVAGYFIDLAVRHPRKPDRFILGIECDGASYHSSRSARDRDRMRQEILEDLGWTIHRIWSVDWLRNPKREVAEITEKVRRLAATQ